MTTAMWDDEDEDENGSRAPGQAGPTLVSLHFIRSSLRRQRGVLLAAGILGIIGAVLYLAAVPAKHTATATIALAHDPTSDSVAAMATDVSLAQTRAVAERTINQLKLSDTPVGFLASVTADPTTTDVLTINLTASSDAEAQTRLAAYTTIYLKFRAELLTSQGELLSNGSNQRIDKLQDQVTDITKRIDRLAGQGEVTGGDEISSLISQRSLYVSQIGTLQDTVETSTLKTTAVIAASRVIDTAAVLPSNPIKRPVLTIATGLIGAGAIAVGLILFFAVISDKLRSRVEVATALEAPVATSLGRITPLPPALRWLPFLRARNARRMADLQRFAGAVEVAIPPKGQGQWLAIACVDNAREVSLGVVTAAIEIQRAGRVVRLVDLTDEAVLEDAVARLGDDEVKLAISRPRMAPALARDASDIVTYGPETREIPALGDTDVFLTLVDLNPSVGAFHLASWTHRVIVAVTAGKSSAERVRTAADLVRTAGLELWSVILTETEKNDVSSGKPLNAVSYADRV